MFSSTRTVIPIALFVLFISCILSIHNGLRTDLVERKICSKNYSRAICNNKVNRIALNFTYSTNKQIQSWERTFKLSVAIPSVFTFLALAGVADWLDVKEKIGFYVSALIAIQSIVYMILAMAHSSMVEYMFLPVLISILFGDGRGSILIAWIFSVGCTGQDTNRTMVFIIVEAMTYVGAGLGKLTLEYLPSHTPLSYAYAASFALSVSCFIIVLLLLPSYESVIHMKMMESEKANETAKSKEKFSFCNHPFNSLRSEYIAGVVLTVALTELGTHGYNALIYSFVTAPSVDMSPRAANVFILSTKLMQGCLSIALAMILVNCMRASDGMIAMISLSSAAFWMALTGFSGSPELLYTLSGCLAIFVPLAVATLCAAGTKENEDVKGNNIMLFALFGVIRILCQSLTMFNAGILIRAGATIHKPISFLIFAIMQLMAFIVIGSITLSFNKPIITEVARITPEMETSKRSLLAETEDATEEEDNDSSQEYEPFLSKSTK